MLKHHVISRDIFIRYISISHVPASALVVLLCMLSQGHDVTYSKYGSFFCDCGAKEDGNCKVSENNSSKAATITITIIVAIIIVI